MNLPEKSSDEASVSSIFSDEGYAEFLRFLQSPCVPKADVKEKKTNARNKQTRDEDKHDRESLPNDGPNMIVALSTEDSMAELSQDDRTESSGSFYIGPGEIGFIASSSVHESDVSETETDDESIRTVSVETMSVETESAEQSYVQEKERTVTCKEKSLSVTSPKASNEDDDEGYNEFLRFLMTPTVAISVSDDGSVTLSVSLKDKEVGSVTLSVKEATVESVDTGYEEFLLFLQSPSPASANKALDVDKINSTSSSNDGSVTISVSLKDKEVESVTLSVKDEATVESADAGYEEFLLFLQSPSPASANKALDVDKINSRSSFKEDAAELIDLTEKAAVNEVKKETEEEAIARSSSPDKADYKSVEEVDTKSPIQEVVLAEAVATESDKVMEELAEREGTVEPASDAMKNSAEIEEAAVDTAAIEEAAVKSVTLEPLSVVEANQEAGPNKITAAAAVGATAVGAAAAAVIISDSLEPIEEEKPQVEESDIDCSKLLTAAVVGTVAVKSLSEADEEKEYDADASVERAASAAADKNDMISPISNIYFSDAEFCEEDLTISKIYLTGADLGEDDLIDTPVPKPIENADNNAYMQSPYTSEGTFSDLPEDLSVLSLGDVKALEQPDIKEKSLEASGESSPLLAIVGKVAINEEFMKSLSSAGSLDEFFDCLSHTSRQSSILENTSDAGGAAHVSVRSGSPVLSLEEFYDCVSLMSSKSIVSESELSRLSRDRSSEYIIRTFLLSLVFHLCQFKLESGVAEICIWGHLCTRFMRSSHGH